MSWWLHLAHFRSVLGLSIVPRWAAGEAEEGDRSHEGQRRSKDLLQPSLREEVPDSVHLAVGLAHSAVTDVLWAGPRPMFSGSSEGRQPSRPPNMFFQAPNKRHIDQPSGRKEQAAKAAADSQEQLRARGDPNATPHEDQAKHRQVQAQRHALHAKHLLPTFQPSAPDVLVRDHRAEYQHVENRN